MAKDKTNYDSAYTGLQRTITNQPGRSPTPPMSRSSRRKLNRATRGRAR